MECLTLKNIRHHNSFDNRTPIELGLPFYSTHPGNFSDFALEVPQKIQTIIIDGLTVVEQEGEPEGTNYISIYDKIETLILKNVVIIKNQKENGTLIHFDKKGEVENYVAESIHVKGLKQLIDDESKIKNKLE
jgi:ribosomal protein L24